MMYGVILCSGLSPIATAVLTEVFLLEEDALFYFWYDIGGYTYTGSTGAPGAVPIPSPWTIYILIYMAVALLLLLITVLQVRRQAKQ
jgi:hypothetical protein